MMDPIQQQLIAARRNQILDAAATVFAAKGFHSTTTRDIARQAGIAEGTIYNYFESKTALLLGIFDRMKDSVIQDDLPINLDDIDLEQFIRMFLYHPLMALKEENFALFRIIVSEIMVNDELREMYQKQILEPTLAVAETYFVQQAAKWGMDPDDMVLMVRAISGLIQGLIVQHIVGDSVLVANWDRLPDVLTQLILNGLNNRSDITDDRV